MKNCYVSIAFGTKPHPDGRLVDYDRVYRELVEPAALSAGLACTRADAFGGALIHKDIVKAVITADVMVADVSNGNPNVMYELGIRHAMRRGATVLLTSTQLPFNISHSYALRYDPGEPATARTMLAEMLREKAERPPSDSPLYEYFPALRVELPADLQPPELRRRVYPPQAQGTSSAGADRKALVEQAEQITRATAGVDPQAYLDVLRRYMNLGQMDDMLRMANDLPPAVRQLPQVTQLVALAQGRLGNTDEAIRELLQSVSSGSDNAESRGLLGSMHKRRYFELGQAADLDDAIKHYGLAYAASPHELYLGRTLAQLLFRKGDDAATGRLKSLLPDLLGLAAHEVDEPPLDYWQVESALILAVIEGDAPQAETLAQRMMELRPQAWMLESTRSELQHLVQSPSGESIRANVDKLASLLQPIAAGADDDAEVGDAQL